MKLLTSLFEATLTCSSWTQVSVCVIQNTLIQGSIVPRPTLFRFPLTIYYTEAEVWWKRESIHHINNVGSTVSLVGPRISSLTSWLDSSAPPLVQTPDALDNSVRPFSELICGGLHHPKSAPSNPHDDCSQDSLLLFHCHILMSMQPEEQRNPCWLGQEPRSGGLWP